MPSSRHDLLELASKLLSAGELRVPALEEVTRRAAVSRAYYAVFHAALEVQAVLGSKAANVDEPEGMHSRLLADLRQAAFDGKADKGYLLGLVDSIGKLRARRVIADYKLRQPVAGELAMQTVTLAATVVKRLESLLPKSDTELKAS